MKFSFIEGTLNKRLELNIELDNNTFRKMALHEFKNFYKYTLDSSSVAFDFLVLALSIYSADRLSLRKNSIRNGWSRDIKIEVPINNLIIFKSIKTDIIRSLNFLTNDYWNITFYKKEYSYNSNIKEKQEIEVDKISLFSGGLDSLIGAIDLLSENENVLLLSHHEFGGLKEQIALYDKLKSKYSNIFRINSFAGIDKNSNYNDEITFRSRSILFIAYGMFFAYNLNKKKVFMSENGIISINLPLTPSRNSSCSTKTTHPDFINMLNNITSQLFNCKIVNKYLLKTKADMVTECADPELLKSIFHLSNSCAKKGHTVNWRNKSASHCGYCLPCIYRRISLHEIESDIGNYGVNIFDAQNIPESAGYDFQIFKEFIDKISNDEETIRAKLIARLIDSQEINDYLIMYENHINQTKKWLQSN